MPQPYNRHQPMDDIKRDIKRTAAERALRQLGARKVATREVPVVWENRVAQRLVGMIARAASGERSPAAVHARYGTIAAGDRSEMKIKSATRDGDFARGCLLARRLVERGVRVVHSSKELAEKLGRNDLCPCGSGKRFKKPAWKRAAFDGVNRDHYF